jgi:phage major head subunit gpT-like protein
VKYCPLLQLTPMIKSEDGMKRSDHHVMTSFGPFKVFHLKYSTTGYNFIEPYFAYTEWITRSFINKAKEGGYVIINYKFKTQFQ